MSAASRKSYGGDQSSRRFIGWAVVAGVHLLVGYALLSGTASRTFEVIKKAADVELIQEVALPPPPPEVKRLVAKTATPAMPHTPTLPNPSPPVTASAPTPEVAVEPAIPAALPSAPAAPSTPAAAVAPLATPSVPGRSEIGVACPTQVAPEMPAAALRDGLDGLVKAQLLVHDGRVREVTIFSGPKIFHDAVRKAAMQYKCANQTNDVLAVQTFVFKNSE